MTWRCSKWKCSYHSQYAVHIAQVTYEGEEQKGSQVLHLLEMDTEAGTSVWGLANVRANRDKRQKLTKKQEAQRIEIPLSTIKQARLHLDA